MSEKQILIKITDDGMSYDTDLSVEEVVFWLEACKQGVISYTFNPSEATMDGK